MKSRVAKAGVGAVLVTGLAGCAGAGAQPAAPAAVSGIVVSGGSSTLGPLTKSIAERYAAYTPGVKVDVAITSTGEGFQGLCSGKLDVANASRPIEPPERQACEKAGIKFTEILAANDAISVIVNKDNGWARCMTLENLKTMWSKDSTNTVTTWRQVNQRYPEEKLALYGPDTTSGTLDVFTQQINDREKSIRTDYTGSEDDNVTVRGVQEAKGGVGFLGYSYVKDNEDIIKSVAIDGGKGCVEPNPTSVRDGSYTPLSRPLYAYVNNASIKDKPQVKAFMEYYVQWARNVAEDSNFVPVTESQRQNAKRQLEAAERAN